MVMNVDNSLFFSNCPLCHSNSLVNKNAIEYIRPIFFSNKEITLTRKPELWKCRNCRSYFTQHIIPEKTAVDLYTQSENNARWSQEAIEKQKPKAILNALSQYLNNSKKVLDIGCNTGSLLDFAKSRNAQTFGIDFSHATRDILIKKGHKWFSSAEDIHEQAFFDVVTAFDVVEHLYDLSHFFKKCHSLLKTGGVLIILTGDVHSLSSKISKNNWWYLKFPEHIVFPSRHYLSNYSGFTILDSINTYAAKDYRKSFISALKSFLVNSIRSCYIGLPALGPDHLLYILSK